MKKYILIPGILLVLTGTMAYSQKYEIDFKNPESVLNAVFYAAQTKEFAILQCLGDPLQESDGDVKQICTLPLIAKQISENEGDESLKKTLDEFVSVFKAGKITGQVSFENYEGDEFANIPFWFEHPGGEKRSNESMQLVKRYGNWYLYSF